MFGCSTTLTVLTETPLTVLRHLEAVLVPALALHVPAPACADRVRPTLSTFLVVHSNAFLLMHSNALLLADLSTSFCVGLPTTPSPFSRPFSD